MTLHLKNKNIHFRIRKAGQSHLSGSNRARVNLSKRKSLALMGALVVLVLASLYYVISAQLYPILQNRFADAAMCDSSCGDLPEGGCYEVFCQGCSWCTIIIDPPPGGCSPGQCLGSDNICYDPEVEGPDGELCCHNPAETWSVRDSCAWNEGCDPYLEGGCYWVSNVCVINCIEGFHEWDECPYAVGEDGWCTESNPTCPYDNPTATISLWSPAEITPNGSKTFTIIPDDNDGGSQTIDISFETNPPGLASFSPSTLDDTQSGNSYDVTISMLNIDPNTTFQIVASLIDSGSCNNTGSATNDGNLLVIGPQFDEEFTKKRVLNETRPYYTTAPYNDTDNTRAEPGDVLRYGIQSRLTAGSADATDVQYEDYLPGVLPATSSWVQQTGGPTDLLAVSFADDQHGWAVGENNGLFATIYMTDDGGESWEQEYNFALADNPVNLNGIHAVDATTAWAVGDNGTILYRDGTGWQALTSGVTVNLNDIHRYTIGATTYVTAVGDDCTVRTSTDNGTTWANNVPPTCTADLHVITSRPNTAVFIAGDNASLYRYDTTWTHITELPNSYGGVTGNIQDIYYNTINNTLHIVSDDGSLTRCYYPSATTCGSLTDSARITRGSPTGIAFISSTTGYITTSTGYIYQTIDIGNTYTRLSSASTPLNGIASYENSTDGQAWAVGDAT
ncbi:MAG TPA: hypothetical protein PKL83_03800, partial [bacterium]|nr:hypothetical protein [bacterium]